MLNLCSIELQAHNPARNCHRRYAMSIGRDLFGAWTLAVEYGRVGRAGQVQRYAADSATDLGRLVRAKLKKRESSVRRNGCDYQVTGTQRGDIFDLIAGLHG
jgi:predicted DNA-binding WGR domain protein